MASAPESADEGTVVAEQDLSVLRSILEGTAAETGEGFFRSLVRNLTAAIGVSHAFGSPKIVPKHTFRPRKNTIPTPLPEPVRWISVE